MPSKFNCYKVWFGGGSKIISSFDTWLEAARYISVERECRPTRGWYYIEENRKRKDVQKLQTN